MSSQVYRAIALFFVNLYANVPIEKAPFSFIDSTIHVSEAFISSFPFLSLSCFVAPGSKSSFFSFSNSCK